MKPRAKCMGCGNIHPLYRFINDKQRCYLLYCGKCGASVMHQPEKVSLYQRFQHLLKRCKPPEEK